MCPLTIVSYRPSSNITNSFVPLRESVPHERTNTLQKAQTTGPPNDSNSTRMSINNRSGITEVAASRQAKHDDDDDDDDGPVVAKAKARVCLVWCHAPGYHMLEGRGK